MLKVSTYSTTSIESIFVNKTIAKKEQSLNIKEYAKVLQDIKQQIREAQVKSILAENFEH